MLKLNRSHSLINTLRFHVWKFSVAVAEKNKQNNICKNKSFTCLNPVDGTKYIYGMCEGCVCF